MITIEPLTEGQAREAYSLYQDAALEPNQEHKGYRIPACRTPWEELPAHTRDLLTNPLYLHLFMQAFEGRGAEAVRTVPALFPAVRGPSL